VRASTLQRKTVLAAVAGVILAGSGVGLLAALDHRVSRPTANRIHPRVRALRLTGDIVAAARYLGLPPRRVRAELRGGQTLAGLAGETAGRSPAGLVAAIVRARSADIAARLAAGLLSPADARVRLAGLRAHVWASVERRR
jgi:hypothetical protein